MQLEIARRVYLNEAFRTFDVRKGARLRATLQPMLEAFTQSHENT